jgi:hypothetical protein
MQRTATNNSDNSTKSITNQKTQATAKSANKFGRSFFGGKLS